MVNSCLHVPDAATWRDDEAYSPSVARLLSYAHTRLSELNHSHSSLPLPDALIRPALGWRMSKRQRLLAYYVLARTALARKEYSDAIGWVDNAYGLATELREVGALAELARLRGNACQELQRFADAADASWDYLVLMRDPRAGVGPDDVAAEVETRIALAQFEFLQENYDLALAVLADADALITGSSEFDVSRLYIAWIRVMLHRWRGESLIALRIAIEVAEAPAIRSSPQVCGRIETIVADLSMDRAEAFALDPVSSIRSTFLTMAGKYLRSSEAALLDSSDLGGAAMARLARVRFSRLTGANEDRLEALDDLERLGRTVPDDALVIQALTARGEELMARGEREPALVAFRQALDLARRSQVAAMGMRARRALLYDQELQV
jgi:tetratricopeptide (TPR) repeat protein